MNTILLYFIEISVTLLICLALVLYLRRSLRRVLVDLCATDDRAQFWMTFASILLMGLPLIFGMGFNPSATGTDQAFFEVANQIKWNLLGFLVTLIGLGAVISFFAMIAPRPTASKMQGG